MWNTSNLFNLPPVSSVKRLLHQPVYRLKEFYSPNEIVLALTTVRTVVMFSLSTTLN